VEPEGERDNYVDTKKHFRVELPSPEALKQLAELLTWPENRQFTTMKLLQSRTGLIYGIQLESKEVRLDLCLPYPTRRKKSSGGRYRGRRKK